MSAEWMEGIRASFKEAFGTAPDTVTIDATPDDIEGWDSLGHAVLASALEEQFSLTFDIDELMEMEDVRSIVAVLQRRLKG